MYGVNNQKTISIPYNLYQNTVPYFIVDWVLHTLNKNFIMKTEITL